MTLPVEWIVPDWPAPGRVRAFVTTRAGGVSAGDYASMNLRRTAERTLKADLMPWSDGVLVRKRLDPHMATFERYRFDERHGQVTVPARPSAAIMKSVASAIIGAIRGLRRYRACRRSTRRIQHADSV